MGRLRHKRRLAGDGRQPGACVYGAPASQAQDAPYTQDNSPYVRIRKTTNTTKAEIDNIMQDNDYDIDNVNMYDYAIAQLCCESRPGSLLFFCNGKDIVAVDHVPYNADHVAHERSIHEGLFLVPALQVKSVFSFHIQSIILKDNLRIEVIVQAMYEDDITTVTVACLTETEEVLLLLDNYHNLDRDQILYVQNIESVTSAFLRARGYMFPVKDLQDFLTAKSHNLQFCNGYSINDFGPYLINSLGISG